MSLAVPVSSGSNRAFTLLEVILAMAVGAIVLLAIQTVFFGALRLRNTASERLDSERALHRALEFVKRDLSGLMLPGGVLSGELQTAVSSTTTPAVSGERIGPEFSTDTGRIDARSGFGDVQRVAYYLSPESVGNSFSLVRTATRNLLPTAEEEPEALVLLEGVQHAEMQFFDGSAWVDTWDSTVTTSLPTAIRFSLQRPASTSGGATPFPIDLVVPISVTTATTP